MKYLKAFIIITVISLYAGTVGGFVTWKLNAHATQMVAKVMFKKGLEANVQAQCHRTGLYGEDDWLTSESL